MSAYEEFMEQAERYGGVLWDRADIIANREMISLYDALARVIGRQLALGPALTKCVQQEIARRVEQQHDNAYLHLQAAATPEDRRYWFDRLKHWKAQRSPEKIRELEEAKGIAP